MRIKRLTTKKVLATETDPYNNRCFILALKKSLYTSEIVLEEHREQDLSSNNGKLKFRSPVNMARVSIQGGNNLSG